MGKTLRLLFNLHPGEGKKAFLFIILGLLWSLGSYGSFVLSEGMFLERVGTQALPGVYFAIALAMCLLSAVLIFALNRFSIRSLLFATISLWIVSNLAFFFLYPSYSHLHAYWYSYKAVGWIIPISTYIVYWAFADQYYDLQDGKRFFCLFNSTTFLGDALGGGIVGYFLDMVSIRGLMVFFTISMLASLPFIFVITKRLIPSLEEDSESIDTTASVNFSSIVRTLLRSRFTLYLIVFYFSMQLLAIVTEFNYLESYEKAFVEAPEHALTEFNSRCSMWISLGNMFFGLFVYSRLIKKMGVNNIIMITPTIFLIIFSFWCGSEALVIAIFGMIAREGMVYSFDDNNLNLLISGVPTKVKNQVRIVVESFIEPAGMFASATLLLCFQAQAHLLGLSISLLALVVVLFLRAGYPQAIFRNLVASAIRFEKKASDYLPLFSKKELKQTEFLLLSDLKSSSEKHQLIAYEYLLKLGNKQILPRLLNHMGKLTLPGKLKALDLLAESIWAKEPLVLERLEHWRRSQPHPAIKSAIHLYLARHCLLAAERVMHDVHHEHLGLRAAAILALKTAPESFPFPAFSTLAREKLQLLLDSEEEEQICMGIKILGLEQSPLNIHMIFRYLSHSQPSVHRTAARSLALVAHVDHKEYAGKIIPYLAELRDRDARLSLLHALEKLSDTNVVRPLILTATHFRPAEHKHIERSILNIQGLESQVLLDILQDRTLCDPCRLLAGKILGKLDRKILQKKLFATLTHEIDRAYFYFYHANTIQRQLPEHDLSTLQHILFTSYESIINFIIQLLGVAGALEQCEVLAHTLRSSNRKIRAQALESLEKTCNNRLFSLIEPLIDDRLAEEKLHHYLRSGGLPLNLPQLLDVMARSAASGDQMVALKMKAQLTTPDWENLLREKIENHQLAFLELINASSH